MDFDTTWDKYYKKYKEELGVIVQAVMQKYNEAWNSFFSLFRRKREGELLFKHENVFKYD